MLALGHTRPLASFGLDVMTTVLQKAFEAAAEPLQ
jgi:hypothetical protein